MYFEFLLVRESCLIRPCASEETDAGRNTHTFILRNTSKAIAERSLAPEAAFGLGALGGAAFNSQAVGGIQWSNLPVWTLTFVAGYGIVSWLPLWITSSAHSLRKTLSHLFVDNCRTTSSFPTGVNNRARSKKVRHRDHHYANSHRPDWPGGLLLHCSKTNSCRRQSRRSTNKEFEKYRSRPS